DTSLVVAALTNERRTRDVLLWLGKQPRGSLCVSEWVVSEFSAALSMKQRVGTLDSPSRAATLQIFREFVSSGVEVLAVGSSHFQAAALFADQYSLGLRAADALHLAIASDRAVTLHTLDERLARAGLAVGVRTVLL
ncbi:MAG: type II toxin-antitoxin system VapC family toxin, partial [Alphaproteobacteria bacterium]|nr:type II toxin-antitoxin system VapC family toxin [Alphaproteobacteria bacterium]